MSLADPTLYLKHNTTLSRNNDVEVISIYALVKSVTDLSKASWEFILGSKIMLILIVGVIFYSIILFMNVSMAVGIIRDRSYFISPVHVAIPYVVYWVVTSVYEHPDISQFIFYFMQFIGVWYPIPMKYIPRHKKYRWFSLKLGSVVSGLILMLFSIFALYHCVTTILISFTGVDYYYYDYEDSRVESVLMAVTVTSYYAATLLLSTLMTVGVIEEEYNLIKPWLAWISVQICVAALLIVSWTATSFNDTEPSSGLYYFFECFGTITRIYMLVIVASFYKDAAEEPKNFKYFKSKTNHATSYAWA